MNTALQTGPGFFAASTCESDKTIGAGVLRICCARIEVYDLPKTSEAMDNVQWELLVAKADKDPFVARALLQLYSSLGANLELLKERAAQ